MGRSLKKGPFVDEHLMKKVEAQQTTKRKIIKTWSSFNIPKFHRIYNRSL